MKRRAVSMDRIRAPGRTPFHVRRFTIDVYYSKEPNQNDYEEVGSEFVLVSKKTGLVMYVTYPNTCSRTYLDEV
jgi:hypothetical protein